MWEKCAQSHSCGLGRVGEGGSAGLTGGLCRGTSPHQCRDEHQSQKSFSCEQEDVPRQDGHQNTLEGTQHGGTGGRPLGFPHVASQ